MKNEFYNLLKKLSNAFGPSGQEDEIRKIVMDQISSFAEKIRVDPFGNLIVTKGIPNDVVVMAHMDEVGFMITDICENGTLHFAQIGGIDPKFLPSKRVRIGRNRIVGIIGAKPVHLSKKGNSATYSDLYLDCGFQNREEAEALIQIGDGAVFDTDCDIFDDQRTFILGKALDNRIGVALLCELIQDDRIENGTFVFTTQEEVGLRGATAFMEANRFKIGIALDTTTANDLPAVLPQNTVTSLNKGGTVSFADGATIYNRDLIRFVTDALMQQKIPWQTKMKRTGGNDAAAIDRAGVGALSISLSTPCRYIHSPIGVVKSSDIEDTYSALLSILSSAETYGDA